MPSISSGFCVAMTKNGRCNSWCVPATVTDFSCIASSNADCVLGVARLISSARIRFANTGPCWNSKNLRPPSSSATTLVPMMSAGIRSGVNCIRENPRSSTSWSVRISSVFPKPGTPSKSACPPVIKQIRTPSIISCCPTICFETSRWIRLKVSRNSSY